jgi:hypothetical protein
MEHLRVFRLLEKVFGNSPNLWRLAAWTAPLGMRIAEPYSNVRLRRTAVSVRPNNNRELPRDLDYIAASEHGFSAERSAQRRRAPDMRVES